jgi:hypothetical protein
MFRVSCLRSQIVNIFEMKSGNLHPQELAVSRHSLTKRTPRTQIWHTCVVRSNLL